MALDGARKLLRDKIIADFLKKAPTYPSDIGESSPIFSYDIAEYDELESNDGRDIIMWAAVGIVNMQDTKMAEKRYRSHIWGHPIVTVKCVKFDKAKMNEWNKISNKRLEAAKHAADVAAITSIKQIGATIPKCT